MFADEVFKAGRVGLLDQEFIAQGGYAMSASAFTAILPIYTDGRIDFQKLSDLMGVPKKELAVYMDVSLSTVHRPATGSTMTKAQPVLHMLNMLWKVFDGAGRPQEIRRWLNEPRLAWRGMTPLDCIRLGKIAAVNEMLEGHFEGEITGV